MHDEAMERPGHSRRTRARWWCRGAFLAACLGAACAERAAAQEGLPELKPPTIAPPAAPAPPSAEALPPVTLPEEPEEEPDAPTEPPEASGEDGAPPSLPPELSGYAGEASELTVEEEGAALTIEELVNSLVVSASNRAESSLTAPAWVITLSAEDLRKRGYVELDEFLDDLPGIDVVRPSGDVYFKDYWRGERNDFASPYLLLVDGVVKNHLWYENTQGMVSFPISSIDRVEVLFGPASAVYGPNAAMGVVNVITRNDLPEDGYRLTSRFGVQTPLADAFDADGLRKYGDMHALVKRGQFRVSVAARFDYGVLDPNISENFEFTKKRYYADRSLWGPFVANEALGGSFHSPAEKLGLDARLFLGGTELAAQYYRLSTGNGSVYPGDRVQTNPPITYGDLDLYMRHVETRQRISSTSMLRYRLSGVGNPTVFLARTPAGAISYSEGKVDNSSVTAQQDLHIDAGENLLVTDDALQFDVGIKYEYKDLERSFADSSVTFPSPSVLESALPSDPEQARAALGKLLPAARAGGVSQFNRTPANNVGGYLLLKYGLWSHHWLNLGARFDYRELTRTTALVFRGGYVGRFMDALTLKLLIGQSNQEPAARFRIGNRDLANERSRTLELNGNYVLEWLAAVADLYWVKSTDPIVGGVLDDGTFFSANVSSRDVVGLDLGLQALPKISFLRQLKVWLYYSSYLFAKEAALVGANVAEARSGDSVRIGDLASHKLLGGLTVDFTRQIGMTVLGRYVSARKTVRTNPVDSVPGFFTLDANLLFQELLGHGLMLALRCTNLLDARYFHPGIKAANSGDVALATTPGIFSAGEFNSMLPQAGRALTIVLGTNL